MLDPGDDLEDPSVQAAIRASRLVEIELEPEPGEGLAAVVARAEQVRALNPEAVIAVRLPLGPHSAEQAETLVAGGIGMLHLCGDEVGFELAGDGEATWATPCWRFTGAWWTRVCATGSPWW